MTTCVGARWVGFHLFAPEPFEPLLLECLAPVVETWRCEGRVRRFFFLRYEEGGEHLRLRLLPGKGVSGEDLHRLLESGLRVRFPDGRWRLEAHPYDREALYFGETRESVYAELLNEATSGLALRLLAAPGSDGRTRRWLALATLLETLLRGSTPGDPGRRAAIAASQAFSSRVSEALGRPVSTSPPIPSAGAEASLRDAYARLGPALAADGMVRHAARLLRRVRGGGVGGASVATHALHLLCNKLGFTLHEEHDLFTALSRLAAGADGGHPPSQGDPG